MIPELGHLHSTHVQSSGLPVDDLAASGHLHSIQVQSSGLVVGLIVFDGFFWLGF